jgi:hypothetical protein
MIAIVGILFLAAVVAVVLVMGAARRWVLDEGATEARMLEPETHALSYLVPNGQDPAALMAALAHANFTTSTDTHGGTERLLVACEEADRAQVRHVLEEANSAGSGGTRMPDHVRFEDEPENAAS